MRLGVIADTHGLYDPAIARHFKGVECIIHAGDIGDRQVVRNLERVAPVVAVSGNVDEYERSGFPRERMVILAGRRIAVRHVLYERGRMSKEAQVFLGRAQPDICIFGHTHQPKIERRGSTVLFNPGSAGPRRFRLPRSLGMLVLSPKAARLRHIRLLDRVAPE